MRNIDPARLATEKAVFRPALPTSFLPGITEMQMSDGNGRRLTDNVRKFLLDSSRKYGDIKAEEYGCECFRELCEGDQESPIEDLFTIAIGLHCDVFGINRKPQPTGYNAEHVMQWEPGVFIFQQFKIGSYRVDFVVAKCDINGQACDPVVVELDGHDFHDKDKKQRSYEKARDRYLVKSGYRVLHFTGSDVVADPYKVAFEVLSMVDAFHGSYRSTDYDPKDPFSQGI